MKNPSRFLALFPLFLGCLLGFADDGIPVLRGPFRGDGLAFFFVHPGGPLKLDVTVHPDGQAKFPKALVRFFDSSEKLVGWNYDPLVPGKPATFSQTYAEQSPAGVYQVRTSLVEATCDVAATPARSFAVMPSRCRLVATDKDQFKEAYLVVTENAPDKVYLKHAFGTWKLWTPDGKLLLENMETGHLSKELETSELRGKILKLSMFAGSPNQSYIAASQMPLFLSPSESCAQAVGSSLNKASDGSLHPFPYQCRIKDFVSSLKRDDLEVEIVPMRSLKSEWEREPNARALIDQAFRYVNPILSRQVIDPGHPDFGKVPGNNFVALARIASLNRPINPYYRNPAIINRALLGLFAKYLTFHENETVQNDENNYNGTDALFCAFEISQAVSFLVPVLDDEMRDLAIEGIQRLADRFPFYHVSCENQSSHWLMTFQFLEEVAPKFGDYARLARDYAVNLTDPERNIYMKTGYQREANGPDATYQGLTNCIQALYYRKTQDQVILDGLKKIIGLMNHSVAPEPDGGRIIGSSGFAHRTRGTWVQRQYHGGTMLLKGVLPEAAVWHRKPDEPAVVDDKSLTEPTDAALDKYPQWFNYPFDPWTSYYYGYEYPSESLQDGCFPAEENDTFWRSFNDEFVAVKTKGYYAFSYTDKSMHEWQRNAICKKEVEATRNNSWNAVHGIQLVWSPEYGTLMASTGWNAHTYAMTAALLQDDTYTFPDYWKLKSEVNEETRTIELENPFLNGEATIRRTIIFHEDEIKVELHINQLKDWTPKECFEQFPIIDKPNCTFQFEFNGVWSQEPTQSCTTFKATNDKGAGFLIVFEEPVRLNWGTLQEAYEYAIKPLKLELGNDFKQGQAIKLTYTIKPIR